MLSHFIWNLPTKQNKIRKLNNFQKVTVNFGEQPDDKNLYFCFCLKKKSGFSFSVGFPQERDYKNEQFLSTTIANFLKPRV